MLELDLGSVTAIVVCGLAAVTDMRTGLIPNWLTFPVILGAPLVHGFVYGPGALLRSLLALFLCGLVPYLLFRSGGMGGGDVKLFAAVGAAAGLAVGLQVEFVSLVLACLWGLGVLAFRGRLLSVLWRSMQLLFGRLLPARWRVPVEEEHLTHVRLGVPIAVATIVCVISERIAAVGGLS